MEGSDLDIIERYTALANNLTLLGQVTLLIKTASDLEDPLLLRFISFE